jgi:hypothetical protein
MFRFSFDALLDRALTSLPPALEGFFIASFLVSITHLAFDRGRAIAREIAAYQERRIKRIRRDSATDSCATFH